MSITAMTLAAAERPSMIIDFVKELDGVELLLQHDHGCTRLWGCGCVTVVYRFDVPSPLDIGLTAALLSAYR